MGETHRKVQIGAGTSTDSTIMSIWVGGGNDPGNTRLDLSVAEWDDLIDYFKRLFGVDLMPFRSERQRRYLWARHPRIARRWARESRRRRR